MDHGQGKHKAPIISPELGSIRASKVTSSNVFNATKPRVKVERPRSTTPLVVFTLLVLAALVIVPFLILRPQTNKYRLLSWTGATVTQQTIKQTVSSAGVVTPEDTREVSVRSAGTLDSLLVKEGDDVRAGQELAHLSAPDLDNALRDAQNALRSARDTFSRTSLEGAQKIQLGRDALLTTQRAVPALERRWLDARTLFQLGGETRLAVDTAQQKLEDARREVRVAQNALTTARALAALNARSAMQALQGAREDLARAMQNQQRAILRAPISGRVVSLDARLGQELRGGDRVGTVTGLERLRVEANVDEASAASVSAGQLVRVTIDDRAYQGRITRVASQVQKTERSSTVKVQIEMLTRPKALLPNTSVGVEIIVGTRKNVPSLPRGAYLSTGGELIAYVLSADGRTAERRQVRFGASDANIIEVLSGVQSGERVVTSSYEAFKDQTLIEIAPSGELK